MFDLKDVKQMRVRLGLTQAELAKEAGVSQSVIAKLESGRIDPGYKTAMRILAALEQRRLKDSPKALDVMHLSVIAVHPDSSVATAVKLMRKHSISQLPVMGDQIVGVITESTIMAHLNGLNSKVGDIMEATPPIVPPNASLPVISNLLQHYSIVLVVEKGALVGIISKSDILSAFV